MVHVAAAGEAGTALSEYARQHGLNVRSLYGAKRMAKAAQPEQPTLTAAAREDAPAFVPVVVKPEASAARDLGEAVALRAQLPNGVQLSWTHRGGNSSALSEMLVALVGLPCSN